MSKKVSHKASITNQPTCGGSRKAGLAPRSTNFMMGVKRNHHFRGTPFFGKAADYPLGVKNLIQILVPVAVAAVENLVCNQ